MIDLKKSGGFIAVGGMACALLAYLGMVPVIDWWGMVVLIVVWLILMRQVIRWFSSNPVGAFWVSVGAFAFWIAFVVGGANTWGWSDQDKVRGIYDPPEPPPELLESPQVDPVPGE